MKVSVETLKTPQGRIDALALIAKMGIEGVQNEKMSNKTGVGVPCLEHDLGNAIRAIQQLHLIEKENKEFNTNYTLTVLTADSEKEFNLEDFM